MNDPSGAAHPQPSDGDLDTNGRDGIVPDGAAGLHASTEDATPVCPHCMADIDPLTNFCPKCGAPISSHATMLPFEGIFAQGWAYRNAVSQPGRPIVVLGMWLIFGPVALIALGAYAGLFMRMERGPTTVPGALAWLLGLALIALYIAILVRVTRGYLARRSDRPGHCRECGYPLKRLPEPRCPECGTPFDPDDLDPDDDEAP